MEIFRKVKIRHLCSALLVIIIFPFLAGWIPIARFTHEQIDIDVYPEYVLLKGYYYYRNPYPFPVTQGLSIPLPIDEKHPSPVQIFVEQLSPEKKEIPVRYILGLHRFEVRLPAREEICVKVEYYQRAPEKNARYILKTTQPWHQPLERGVYRLFAHNVKINTSNYAITRLESDGQGFIKENFMPQEDWTFSWETQ
jgi:hypothetical protein